ncbi:nucleoporin [Gigaspora margarita]|uniref:Nucleoporin n=2 Tax=Gigaspora margarita TaxID=4874 RepID=A0A8H3XJY5_GIGMA|nr:nucleoporin [Gigaspora margarita]
MLDFTDWKPNIFQTLREHIESISFSASESGLKDLNHNLQENKVWFINLLDIPPQNLTHKQQLEQQCSAIINQKDHKLSRSFVIEALSISDFLKTDEFFAATLLHHGTRQRAKFNRPSAETAILLFLKERGDLLACLSSLIGSAYNPDTKLPVRNLFSKYIDSVFSIIPSKDGSFARKILSTIQKLKTEIIELDGRSKQLLRQPQTLISAEQNLLLQQDYTLVNFNIDIISVRIKQSKVHQRYLAHNLWLISYNYLLDTVDIMELTTILRNAEIDDVVCPYLIVSLLSALDTSPEHISADIPAKNMHEKLIRNKDFINNFTNIIDKERWKIEAARATTMIQWCPFILDAIHKSPTLEAQLIIKEEHLGEMFQRAVAKDAFQFILHYLLSFQNTEMESMCIEIMPSATSLCETLSPEDVEFPPPGMVPETFIIISEDFELYIRKQLELFVISIVTKMGNNLQRIRRQEEDAIQSADAESLSRSTIKKSAVIRHDTETFFFLIANIYRNHPDEGFRFWMDLKEQIIDWGSSVYEKGMRRGYLEMLCSLATGPYCSGYADEFLSRSSEQNKVWCSWRTLIGTIDIYTRDENDEKQIVKDEVMLLISFIRVFRQVIQYSIQARLRFLQDNVLRLLFRLMCRNVHTELKAELLYAIASFCMPDYADHVYITRQIWNLLEDAQIVPTVPKDIVFDPANVWEVSSMQAQDPPSIKKEIEETESREKLFFVTLAFVRFISELIYIPHFNASLRCGFPVRSMSIDDDLGVGYRQPGIAPYINFILDDIFIKALARDYKFPTQQWNIISASLEVIEKCLISFDLTGPLFYDDQSTHSSESTPFVQRSISKDELILFNNNAIKYLKNHPGFDIMKRLLNNSPLVDVMFNILNQDVESLDEVDEVNRKSFAPFVKESILRCLRIFWLAFEKQERFLNKLIPLISQASPGYLENLENAFLSKQDIIVQIALLLNCENAEICLYAVKILSALARSSLFNPIGVENRLAAILDSDPSSEAILDVIVMRLDINSGDDIWDKKYRFEDFELTRLGLQAWAIPGDEEFSAMPSIEDTEITFGTVRCAILDLILENLRPDKTPPTISHFLLGYDLRGSLQKSIIKYINQDSLRESCLHKILEILGQPIHDDTDIDRQNPVLSEFPALTACCYQIIYRLCRDNHTSEPTMLFLRSQGFVQKQFASMPLYIIQPSQSIAWDSGTITNYNKGPISIDLINLCANINQRTWLMKILALELRKCQTLSGIEQLLALILGANIIKPQEGATDEEVLAPSAIKTREILHMLELDWNDPWKIDAPENFLSMINQKACLALNERGNKIYRLRDIFSELNQAFDHSRIAQDGSLRKKMMHILRYCYYLNRNEEFNLSRYEGFKAWREVIEVIIIDHYTRLRLHVRETTFLEILSTLLTTLQREGNAIAIVLSKVILAAITAIRSDRMRLHTSRPQSRVASRNLSPIFSQILECLFVPGIPPDVRNNLYATIYNYLHYIDVQSAIGAGKLLKGVGDRLLDIIFEDASNGHVVGKLCALNALTAIYRLLKQDKGNLIIKHIKSNFLGSIITSLTSQNDLLLQAKEQQPELNAMHAIYVFEARMGLLLCLAQRHDLSLELLKKGIIEYLGELTFLNERPSFNSHNTDSYGKPVYKLYHDILMMVIRLITCILATVGYDEKVLNKVSNFICGHQGLIAEIFTDIPPFDYLNLQNSEKRAIFIMTVEVLQEITRLFYILGDKIKDIDKVRRESHQSTYQEFLKELISRLFPARKRISSMIDDETSRIQYIRQHVENINENLLGWCQKMTFPYKKNQVDFEPIFTASLDAAKRPDDDYHGDMKHPELSILVNYLRDSIENLDKSLQNLDKLTSQLDKGEDAALSFKIEGFSSISGDLVVLNDSQRKALAYRTVQEDHNTASKRVSRCLYDVEVSLPLLWRHLDYYLNPKRTPVSQEYLRKNAPVVLKDILTRLENLEKQPKIKEILEQFGARDNYFQESVRKLNALLDPKL